MCAGSSKKVKYSSLFHRVMTLLADQEWCSRVRIIQHVTAAEDAAHSEMALKLKGSSAVKQLYLDFASGSWIKVLSKAIRSMMDLPKLGRIGYTVQFGGA
jgi:hypothetical protein